MDIRNVAVKKQDSIWSRGLIERIWSDFNSNLFAKVYLIDYGTVLTAVPVSTRIKPLPDDPDVCLEITWPGSIEFRLAGIQPAQLGSELDNPNCVGLMPCKSWTPSAKKFILELLAKASKRAFIILDGIVDTYTPRTQPVETGHLHIRVPTNIEELMPHDKLYGVYLTGDNEKMLDLNLCLYQKGYATISDGVKPKRTLQPSQRLRDLANQCYRLERHKKVVRDVDKQKQEEDVSEIRDILNRFKMLDPIPERPTDSEKTDSGNSSRNPQR